MATLRGAAPDAVEVGDRQQEWVLQRVPVAKAGRFSALLDGVRAADRVGLTASATLGLVVLAR